MKKNIILFTIICMLSVNVVYSQDLPADTHTGNYMYGLYKSYKKYDSGKEDLSYYSETLIYMSYVQGMWNTFYYLGLLKEKNKSKGQIQDGYGQFLENNPEIRDKSSVHLFLEWLDKVGWIKEEWK